MARRAAERIAEAAGRSFVGRSAELERLRGLILDPAPGPLIVFVHGPGGIGKSRLLTEVVAGLPPDVPATVLDCAAVEPTPAGLLAAICGAGAPGGAAADVDAAAAAVARGCPRAVLVLDRYEAFTLLDAWLRRELLPQMPLGLLTIAAGRGPPPPGWRTDPGWGDLVAEMPLHELDEGASAAFLAGRALDPAQVRRALRFARGHPLALTLAASALRAEPSLEPAAGPPPAVVGELVRAILAGLDPETVRAAEAAATVRRVTEPLLAAMLERGSAREPFGRLRRLPFSAQTARGVLLHEVARDAISQDLGHRDPDARAAYRRRAAGYLGSQVRRARPGALWELTADLLFLIDHDLVRDAFFSPGSIEHSVEPAGPADHPAIAGIAAAWEPGDLGWLAPWLDRHPAAFRVVRDAAGDVSAFVAMADAGSLDPAVAVGDPVAAAIAAHLDRRRMDPGERALLVRRGLSLAHGERPSAELGAAWLDLKRTYLELRPRLRRVYVAMTDPAPVWPAFAALGFATIAEGVLAGGSETRCAVLDMGPRSVDGWLSGLLDVEVEAEAQASRPPGAPAPPDADPDPLGELTPREREVVRLLADGLSNRAIADRLVISAKTVGRHVENIYARLGIRTRAQAARLAAESGMTRRDAEPGP